MNVKRILVVGAVAGMLAVTGCSSNLPENNQGNRNGQRVVDSVNRRGDTYNDFNAYDRDGGDYSTRVNRGFLRRSNREGGRVTRAMRRETSRLERGTRALGNGATELGRETERTVRRATNNRPEHTFRYNQNAGTTTRGLNNNTSTNFNAYDQGWNADCCDITGNTAVTRNSTIRNTVPTRNSTIQNTVPTRNLTIQNTVPTRNSTIQNTVPTRNSTIQNTVPTRNSTIQNTVPTRNSIIQNTVPTRNSTIQNTVPTRNTIIRNTVPTRNTAIQATVPASNSISNATPAPSETPKPAPKSHKTRAVATTATAPTRTPKAPEVKPQTPQATTQASTETFGANVTRAQAMPTGTVTRSFSTNAMYPHPYAPGAPTARLLTWPQSALSAPLGVPNEAEMTQILESRNASIQKNALNLTPETNVRRLAPVEHSVSDIPVAVLVPSKDPGVTLEEALNRAERRALRRNHTNPGQQTPAESPAPTSFEDSEFDEVDNEFNNTSDNSNNETFTNDSYFNNQQNTTPENPAPNIPVKPSAERTMK